MPWVIRKRENQWCIYKQDAQGNPSGDSLGCHPSENAAQAQMRALHASEGKREISGKFSDVIHIHELRGSYPNVSIAPDVDYAELIKGDADPVFLTLPIGKPNVKSGNGRFYDDAFIQELARQTLELKPVGIMGHLRAEEMGTAFPAEAVHWVGATFDASGMLWGKGYIPPGDARERIRRYKAQGRALATSIDAFADGRWDDSLSAYRMDSKSLRLGQIDIAPANRAGIPDLAAIPHLSREMEDAAQSGTPPHSDSSEDQDMDRTQVIREMTAADAAILPDAVRQAVLSSAKPPVEVEQLQAIRSELGLQGDADPLTAIKEMRKGAQELRSKSISLRIKEIIADPEKGIKVEALRPMVQEMISLRNPASPEEVDRIYGEVIATDAVKNALSAFVSGTMGPAQSAPVGAQSGKAKYFAIPEKEAA